MAQNYQQGGWYDNPATGKNQRWWNGGFLPVGQTDPGGSSNNNSGGNNSTQNNNNSGSNNSVQSILDSTIKSLSSSFPSPVTPFEQVDPFSFDTALAKQASTAEYDPYYKQLLSDYTGNVQTTLSRSQQDLSTTLEQLQKGKDYYTGTERRMLDQATKQTNQGYAGRGLFFSGAKQQDINSINTEYNAQTGQYNDQYQYNVNQANQTAERTKQDVGTAQSQYTRDTNNAEQSAIAGGVLQRQTEAQTQYESARQAYYSAAQYGSQDAAKKAIAGLPGVTS